MVETCVFLQISNFYGNFKPGINLLLKFQNKTYFSINFNYYYTCTISNFTLKVEYVMQILKSVNIFGFTSKSIPKVSCSNFYIHADFS